MKNLQLFFVISLIVFVLLSCVAVLKKKPHSERYYQNAWCLKHGGKTEVVMPDKTRCDCITDNYAVEFDFASKWAEAIGQSLNYARHSGKTPGVFLICRKKNDSLKLDILMQNIRHYNLRIKVWSLNC